MDCTEKMSPAAAIQVLQRFFRGAPLIQKLTRKCLEVTENGTSTGDELRKSISDLLRRAHDVADKYILSDVIIDKFNLDSLPKQVKENMEKLERIPRVYSSIIVGHDGTSKKYSKRSEDHAITAFSIVLDPKVKKDLESENNNEWVDVLACCEDIPRIMKMYIASTKGKNGASIRLYCIWLGDLLKVFGKIFVRYKDSLDQASEYEKIIRVCSTAACLARTEWTGKEWMSDESNKQFTDDLKKYLELENVGEIKMVSKQMEEPWKELRIKTKKEMIYLDPDRMYRLLLSRELGKEKRISAIFAKEDKDDEIAMYQIPRFKDKDGIDTREEVMDCNKIFGPAMGVLCDPNAIPEKTYDLIAEMAAEGHYGPIIGAMRSAIKSLEGIRRCTVTAEELLKRANENVVANAIGFTKFENEIYENRQEDGDACSFMALLSEFMSMILDIRASSFLKKEDEELFYDWKMGHSMELNIRDYEDECDRISEIYTELTRESLKEDMKKILVDMLRFILRIPTLCIIWKVNEYIEEKLYPKIMKNPESFMEIFRAKFEISLAHPKNHQNMQYFQGAFEQVAELSKTYDEQFPLAKRARKNSDRLANLTDNFVLISAIPLPSNSATLPFHMPGPYYIWGKCYKEFKTLSGLFCLGSCLSTTLGHDGNPITFSDHNVRSMAEWRDDDGTCLKSKMDVPEFFNFLFEEIFTNPSSKLVPVFANALRDLVMELFFLGDYQTDERLNAHIDNAAKQGDHSALLCRGYAMIPRLKKWIKECARLAIENQIIHKNVFDKLISKKIL